ncbi:TadE/TadG family type IV pilus assembly protein [Novosphingobium sp. PY1]|uniref:TadE/TadG family type IV pilus assembly protein n=1 Tax=Novosphingobium sp. PY1 TaxID=1882221 RepID=UPI001A8CDC06|nr:TadE/TadG family type IV pilus assembly protein [Novosphingobium sp. PY1]GFM30749.1 TadE family protein [Novosphingobium sp. PY1]
MRLFSRLARSTRGATIVEFALVAPIFLIMLFGIIEGSRAFWVKQTLERVAHATARCMSVDSACATTATQKQYALERAKALGVTVEPSGIVITGATTCKGNANSNSVTIARPFDTVLRNIVPIVPQELSGSGCFPILT